MTLADELKTVAEETKGGDRIKTADLVNLSFTINGYTVEDKSNKDGTPAVDDMGVRLTSYVGHIVLDGEEREAWLDGQTVRPQLNKIRELNGFPVKVKLIMDEKRYVLRVLDDQPAPTVTPTADLPTLIKAWQKRIGGKAGLDAMILAGTVPEAISAALVVDAGVLTWRLAGLNDGALAALATALTEPETEITVDDIPFE
jgi:hypothetical protein